MQTKTETTDTIAGMMGQPFLLKDGSLPTEDFYRLHDKDGPVHLLLLVKKIAYRKRTLLNIEDLRYSEEALMFSQQGINLLWIKKEQTPSNVVSSCADKTVHVCSRESPWAIPVSFFHTEVFRILKKIHPHCNQADILDRMTVESVSKDEGIYFAKVGID